MAKYYTSLMANIAKGDIMQTPKDVEVMQALHAKGWGSRRIANELKIARKTVQRYLRAGKWMPYRKPNRSSKLKDRQEWITDRFLKHRGNAEVVRQELEAELGIRVSLRTLEREVEPIRRELRLSARATVRFETPPGKQMQVDFGSTQIPIGGERVKVFLFVGTLGFSRRVFVAPFQHERQEVWIRGLENSFHHFGGVPCQVLVDNARALVQSHNPATREVTFNSRFQQFALYWGFTPKACAPYRARTKGKDERMVGYVKRNGVAGREFASWEALERHLLYWMVEVADKRTHGTTGELPDERFKQEAPALKPLTGRPPFLQIQECQRRVHTDACIELETNWYSVPWQWIGALVRIQIVDNQVLIFHGRERIAVHPLFRGRRERLIQRGHLKGIVGQSKAIQSELQRPLEEYEALVGGGW